MLFGLKEAKQKCGNATGVKEIFDYIQKVEDMRHCEDPAAAALLASQHNFTLDHVPAHLLTSQEVSFAKTFKEIKNFHLRHKFTLLFTIAWKL